MIVLALWYRLIEGVVILSLSLARILVFSKAAPLIGFSVISYSQWFDKLAFTHTPANLFIRFCSLGGGKQQYLY